MASVKECMVAIRLERRLGVDPAMDHTNPDVVVAANTGYRSCQLRCITFPAHGQTTAPMRYLHNSINSFDASSKPK